MEDRATIQAKIMDRSVIA
jgi:hypothetical protein